MAVGNVVPEFDQIDLREFNKIAHTQGECLYTTRIAPSPTGDMHLGTARTAYFNWLAAKASGGKFILRIDDTDESRDREECVDVIYKSMEWLGLSHDNTFRQSQCFDRYKHLANELVKNGHAVVDGRGCTILDYTYSFKCSDGLGDVPLTAKSWNDECVGEIAFDPRTINGLTIMRSNGVPTYNFASVIDDRDSEVNFIIRGSDHISNTSKQVMIWDALNTVDVHEPLPKFAHVGLINKDGKKLSKRDNAASMLWYSDNGYKPEALLNFMVRMGWGPTVDDKSTTLLPRERMLELFLTGGRMRAAPSGFDQNKLDFYNRKYQNCGELQDASKMVLST